MNLRLANSADVPSIAALIPLSVRALHAAFYTPAQIEAALGPVFGVDRQLIEDGTYFVAEVPDAEAPRIVGCGGWSRRRAVLGGDGWRSCGDELIDPARDAARIRAFFVHPDFARQGIGRVLLMECEAAIVRHEFASAELVATLAGEPFYAAFGYEVAERYEVPMTGDLHLPVVRMRRRFGVPRPHGNSSAGAAARPR